MAFSLRLRLFAIILLPLLVIATAVGLWRIDEARKTAEVFYDRNLVFTAIAIARDMALLDGDAISPETAKLLSEAAGGPVRYHVYAPDGVFITGYARPPIPIGPPPTHNQPFAHFYAVYKGAEVRVLRLWDVSQIDGLSGVFTITVWQDRSVRKTFVRSLASRALIVIFALIGTVAFVVWFGVNLGLKPLLDLEDAISKRSPKDLSPIRRKVPPETQGIVQQLNRLIAQMKVTQEAQKNFISDAAHQLRNPIAGIHALAEAILTAKTLKIAKQRADDLVEATQHAGTLAERLLTLERIQSQNLDANYDKVALGPLLTAVVKSFQETANKRGLTLDLQLPSVPVMVLGEALMLSEAITNLLDNSLKHAGPNLTTLSVQMRTQGDNAVIEISDDGIGLTQADIPKVTARFGQAQPGEGSGLGIPIAEAVMSQHGGTFKIVLKDKGLTVRLTLPLI